MPQYDRFSPKHLNTSILDHDSPISYWEFLRPKMPNMILAKCHQKRNFSQDYEKMHINIKKDFFGFGIIIDTYNHNIFYI